MARIKLFHLLFLGLVSVFLIGDGMAVETGSWATPIPSPTDISSPGQPVPSSLATAAVSPTASPVPAPSPMPPDPKQLLKEYVRAQKSELKALEHQQSFEIKELKASQRARFEEWKIKEEKARHEYMNTHKGPENRAYVQDFIERRKVLLQMQTDELAQRAKEQEIHLGSLKSDQANRLAEFNDFVKKGQIPPHRLWPQPGR